MSKDVRFSQEPPRTVSTTLMVPADACDCHGHIFPSPDLYPTFNDTMPLAPVDLYLNVHAQLGFERGVLVQGGAYRFDNRAMLDALDEHPGALRGVLLLPADTPEADLAALTRRNVRALRFTTGGASRIDDFPRIAPILRTLGLHAEMFIGLQNFVERSVDLLAQGVPLVLDHLAGPFEPAMSTADPSFRSLLKILADHELWVKLTPQRNSARFPDYVDVRPFQEALIEVRPDRLVWGSDWPFPNMSEATPDLGRLVSLFGEWVSDPALRQRILVENPGRLYAFP